VHRGGDVGGGRALVVWWCGLTRCGVCGVGHHQGPGLAIRIIGDITREKLDILRHADTILIEELHRANIYREIAQVGADQGAMDEPWTSIVCEGLL
jgi:hypothetical protein